eukprot:scaffold18570_cov71-Phaeocystis_antarctica.AAC.2
MGGAYAPVHVLRPLGREVEGRRASPSPSVPCYFLPLPRAFDSPSGSYISLWSAVLCCSHRGCAIWGWVSGSAWP